MTDPDDLDDDPPRCLDCGSERCPGWPLCTAPDDPWVLSDEQANPL